MFLYERRIPPNQPTDKPSHRKVTLLKQNHKDLQMWDMLQGWWSWRGMKSIKDGQTWRKFVLKSSASKMKDGINKTSIFYISCLASWFFYFLATLLNFTICYSSFSFKRKKVCNVFEVAAPVRPPSGRTPAHVIFFAAIGGCLVFLVILLTIGTVVRVCMTTCVFVQFSFFLFFF